MFGQEFRYDLIRKYVALFGSLFNDITISRFDDLGAKTQNFKVPIAYGPREKYLGMTKQKPEDKIQSIILPRMAFEITGYSYDSDRQADRFNKWFNEGATAHTFELSPWDINFDLSIIVKNNIDGTRIVEQILPYFDPCYSVSAELINDYDPIDLKIDLNNVQHEDLYVGNFEERRTVIWTLSFVLHGYFAKGSSTSKLIKFVEVNTYPTLDIPGSAAMRVTTQPGLTANGQPTTDIDETIPYTDIEADDNYGIITIVTDIT
ncbi:tail sheath stabilization protein [Rhizobium phage RHph_I1_18]|nr:tail sheath stabilization protein [Rhizobium phage RHph_I1_18]